MIKRRYILSALALASILLCARVYAEDASEMADELIDEYSGIYAGYLTEGSGELIDSALSPYYDGFSLNELISRAASGEIPFSVKGVTGELGMCLFGEVLGVLKSMTLVVALALLSAFLSSLSVSFGKESINHIAYYACFIAVISIASGVFYDVMNTAGCAIENLALFMRCIVPVMITSLVTSGAIVSAAALEPFMLGITEISLTLIEYVFEPLVMIGTALGIVNSLSKNLKTTGVISLINKFVKYGLSVLLTIFVALAGLKSIAASGADGLTIKLTKFASSNLIPVVGGILSEAVETVMNCSVVIKNALGVIGVIVVFFIAIMPVIKIIASLIVFRLTAAVYELIDGKGAFEGINVMADGISAIFSMLAAVTVMFIMIISVMINISI